LKEVWWKIKKCTLCGVDDESIYQPYFMELSSGTGCMGLWPNYFPKEKYFEGKFYATV
jgi:hypothetical protein